MDQRQIYEIETTHASPDPHGGWRSLEIISLCRSDSEIVGCRRVRRCAFRVVATECLWMIVVLELI